MTIVAQMYPARTDDSGATWYRPAFESGSPPSMWGWTSQPDQAHEDYQLGDTDDAEADRAHRGG